MKILGVDVNTRYVAISAVVDGKFNGALCLPFKVPASAKKNAQERLFDIVDALDDWLTGNPTEIDWVYVEDVPMVRNVKTVKDLQAVVTATQLGFRKYGIPTTLVNVSVWKAQTVGNGKASKSEVRQWAHIHAGIPLEGYVEDAYDATCIAFMGAVAAGDVKRVG